MEANKQIDEVEASSIIRLIEVMIHQILFDPPFSSFSLFSLSSF